MRVIFLALCSLMFGLAEAEAPAHPAHYTPENVILILGAVPQEIVLFREALGSPKAEELWGIPYYSGRIAGKMVVVAITGVGKTFTGMTSTLFIAHFKPRAVLMSGTGAR